MTHRIQELFGCAGHVRKITVPRHPVHELFGSDGFLKITV